MTPQTQLRWTIILALLMWTPAMMMTLSGQIDFMKGGLTFVGALILSYVGLSVIAHIVNGYQRTQAMFEQAQRQIELIEQRKAEEEAEAQEEEEHNRRKDD